MIPNKKSQADLIINDDVFSSMAGTAALEVPGVTGLCEQLTDIKGFISKAKGGAGGVRVSHRDGEISLDVYICVKRDAKILDVAENVQQNVKKTVQDMTNCAVSRVNVHIADVEIPAEVSAE